MRGEEIEAISEALAQSSLRLAAQDVALSRRKQGFESPRERQHFQHFLSFVLPCFYRFDVVFKPV